MITIDFTQLDVTSACIGAVAYWIFVRFILQYSLSWIIIPSLAIILGKSRETVINELVESSRKKFEKLLPHWTVKR